jgi:hypothetical protein
MTTMACQSGTTDLNWGAGGVRPRAIEPEQGIAPLGWPQLRLSLYFNP